MKRLVDFLSLFSSTGTLFCCALPALFVSLGAGAVFASLVSSFPFLITLSEYKVVLFVVAGIMILVSGYLEFFYNKSCPIDKKEACSSGKKFSKIIFYISVGIYILGFSFAFILPKLI
ncbi:MAG: Unknown protein [uncultured Campylobacterales bacterium]|uniref:Mercuric transport protein MerT n=1 Tax=uncultured Campylobacterales bacterium TaxID=352960 RepID=A0A6S6SJ44_9BACT|nr:MAG: Unknown protein [uncultured Campylobacterales bacterium]